MPRLSPIQNPQSKIQNKFSPRALRLGGQSTLYDARMAQENLWAPWRMAYLRELKQKADVVGWSEVSIGGFLSEYWRKPQDDDVNLVVYRNAHGLVLLNRYPYANGHLMAALGESRPTLLDYDPPQRAHFWRLVEIAIE